MARRPREDFPNSWHHVVNRGIAKRALFEDRSEVRFFLAQLAKQYRKGRIEVHAFCLMTTHFHLLVRSPQGELSEAMHSIQSAYSRHFNRRHRRDGALTRGRYFSKPVNTKEYRRTVVQYIDHNPVSAGLVSASAEYEFGSAKYYQQASGPRWLTRAWVEAETRADSCRSRYNRQEYWNAFGPKSTVASHELAAFVEARTFGRTVMDQAPELLSLLKADVLEWLQRKAKLADGHKVGLPVCTPNVLRIALQSEIAARGPWAVEADRKAWLGSRLASAALLHDLCGLTWGQIAAQESEPAYTIRRSAERHYQFVRECPAYLDRALRVVKEANRIMREFVTKEDGSLGGVQAWHFMEGNCWQCAWHCIVKCLTRAMGWPS